MNGYGKPHVVAVPFPALGHAIPLLDFARLLASHGLTVSYVTTPANVPRLQQQIANAISSRLDVRLVVLPTPAIEGLAEGLESFDQVHPEQFALVFQLAFKLEHAFNRWLLTQFEKENQQGTGPPVCILHDVLLKWKMVVPEERNIPRVVFSTYGAFGLSVLHSAWLSAARNAVEKEGESIVLRLGLPNALRLHKNEIDPFLFDPLRMEYMNGLQSVVQSHGMVLNTLEQLESEHLQHWRNVKGKKVWSIGPVFPPNAFDGSVKVSARGKMADISEEELLKWLDSQSPSSVVYISFGSQAYLSQDQCKALASGLEASGQPFVWSIKICPKIEPMTSERALDVGQAYLPEGFQERTKNRGLVTWGWLPQLLLLSHPSVGAFMSHCGWNSMLESVTLGVPMIMWPMNADQHFNSKLAVKLGIGVQVCEHSTGIPDKERVKNVVRLVLTENDGKEMRSSAAKLKEMARKSVACGGSSFANLQDFLSEIHRLHIARMAVVCAGSSKVQIQDGFHSEFLKLGISEAT
ncbi:scopoletin glucosyltransferase [Cryptomeria japonica]|uniref:scopoletin glucosyltransferase n=1 Tax=Cryptomeria japonica TaxID=3369 RepID=UPI0027DA9A1B|nr:scopoletin glucosyltransferase [Cryptomeria japonica]